MRGFPSTTAVRNTLAALGVAVLVACGGTPGSTPATTMNNPLAQSSPRRPDTGKLVLRIRVPRKARHLRIHGKPAYVSPATAGLTLRISGLASLNETVALSPTSPNCVNWS